MGTGRYALGLNFKGTTPPTGASPVVAEADGTPEHAGDGQADDSSWVGYGIGSPVIDGINPDNGVSSDDGVTNSPNISLFGSAPSNDVITIFENGAAIGQTIALASDTWSYSNTATALSDGGYSFAAVATDLTGYSTSPSSPYQVVIDTHVPNAPVLNVISPETGSSGAIEYTNVNTPTFSGTTEPFAVVYLYANGSDVLLGSTEADINGDWSWTVGQPGQVTYPGATSSILSPVVGLVEDVTSLLGLESAPGFTSRHGGRHLSGTGTSPSVLADGTYNVTGIVMDVAGTFSAASSPETIVVDTQPPPAPLVSGVSTVTVPSTTGGMATTEDQTISGTVRRAPRWPSCSMACRSATRPPGRMAPGHPPTTTIPNGNYKITAQGHRHRR